MWSVAVKPVAWPSTVARLALGLLAIAGISPRHAWGQESIVNADLYYAPSSGQAVASTAWQLLPDGLLYEPYLAGVKESRISGVLFHERDEGWLLDVTLGGRVGILRYASGAGPAWQLDLEGAAFPRLDLAEDWDLVASDFRFGVPLTYAYGNHQIKFGYYHLSSHLGDELLVRRPELLAERINFSRDVLVLGLSHYIHPAVRLYAEAGWAFYSDGGSEPWEFQFGVDYSPVEVNSLAGAPFLALNGHLREENNFGGNLVAQAGWQWRGATGHRFRAGVHYYNGHSNQYEFFRQSEEQFGFGLWYDY